MKKILSIAFCLFLMAGVLSGCGNTSGKNKKINIVATIFPEYDWTKAIIGENTENVNLTLLLKNGVDLHSFQPSADDIITVASADIFIYVGGESDKWVKDLLKEAKNKNMRVINLLDVLGNAAKEETLAEGMQSEAEEENQGEETEPEYDEHVWLSVKNAEIFCKSISEKLIEADSQNKEAYQSNTDAYLQKLTALDGEYQAAVKSGTNKTLLFGDRFPFRYLADDYSLNYFAAFKGCSAETEASFETVTFLAKKTDELGLTGIITTEGNRHKIAETIISNTKHKNQKILVLDSMQSVTSKDMENNVTYLSVMEKNLAVLKEALK